MMSQARNRPLEGIKVLDLSLLAPGPYCTMLLADLGAEVIAVRSPGVPRVDQLSRGKTFITLNLKAEAGQEALRHLARWADVFVEGFRPGVADRLGAGYAALSALNPRLIYCSITGYGQTGPRALEAGHDINYLAIAGVLGATGPTDGPPQFPLNLLADFAAGGLLAAFGILAGLLERERTGEGTHIDAAMIDGAYSMMAMHVPVWGTPAMPGRGQGLVSGSAPFYRCYECADGRFVAVGPLERRFFEAFWRRLELGEPPNPMESAAWPAITHRLEECFRRKSRDEWVEHFHGVDACVSPVLEPKEACVEPQLTLRHPQSLPAAPVIPRIGGEAFSPPPTRLSDQTREILSALGMQDADVAEAAHRNAEATGFTWPPELV
jgi:alpha-methylacyl-CoA racemase